MYFVKCGTISLHFVFVSVDRTTSPKDKYELNENRITLDGNYEVIKYLRVILLLHEEIIIQNGYFCGRQNYFGGAYQSCVHIFKD